MSLKKSVIDHILAIEGGYSFDPADSGGETNFGITLTVARAYGYLGPMADMPREVAFNIYDQKFWQFLKLDEISKYSEKIAEELADTAVNQGQGTAAKFFQLCLNVFNRAEKSYSDIAEDGQIGRVTIFALREYFRTHDLDAETVLFNALNSLQGARYINLAKSREKDERFVYGWLRNRVSIT